MMVIPGNAVMQFKRYPIYQEFCYLDARLMAAIISLAYAFSIYHGKPLIVTCVRRTPEENAAVGGNPNSGHMADPVRALDVRTGAVEGYPGLTDSEIDWIKGYWDRNFRQGPYWSCIVEDDHLHFQVPTK